MTNEGQFAFNVDSCVMSQHLRGTLTYIVKVRMKNGVTHGRDPYLLPAKGIVEHVYWERIKFMIRRVWIDHLYNIQTQDITVESFCGVLRPFSFL